MTLVCSGRSTWIEYKRIKLRINVYDKQKGMAGYIGIQKRKKLKQRSFDVVRSHG